LLTLGLIFLIFWANPKPGMAMNQNTSDFKNRMQETKRWRWYAKDDWRTEKVWKTFINFDKNASIYKKAGLTAQGGGGRMMMSLLVVAEPIIKCRKSFTVDKSSWQEFW
jgi:hypothetical protein